MTPIPCIAEGGEFGDCWRACIASILDLCATEVPHFFQVAVTECSDAAGQNALAYRLAREWLAERGLGIFRLWVTGEWSLEKLLSEYGRFNPEVPFIIHGTPARGRADEEAHAVVALNGAIAHDPSGVGISGPCECPCTPDCAGLWWIDVIAPSDHWNAGDLA